MSIITLTANAKKQLISIIESNPDNHIMFSVDGGGCAGFGYNMELINKDSINENDEVVELDDDKKLIIDSNSIMYIIGTTIDYKSDIMESTFIYNNPNAANSCGCGTSFSIDF